MDYQILEAHKVEEDVSVSVDLLTMVQIQETLRKHGSEQGISYSNTSCALEGGFYFKGEPYKEGEGMTRNHKVLSCGLNGPGATLGNLTIFFYEKLIPKVQEAISETLKAGGFELKINQQLVQ